MTFDFERQIVTLQAGMAALKRCGALEQNDFDKAADCLQALLWHIQDKLPVFCLEPWLGFTETQDTPSEMLLRLSSADGQSISPYPAIMTFYKNGFAETIDTILFEAALWQTCLSNPCGPVAINIAPQSLLSAGFVETILDATRTSPVPFILELHESAPFVQANQTTLRTFRQKGIQIALDDVDQGLGDIYRLRSFAEMADYIKIRKSTLIYDQELFPVLPALMEKAVKGTALVIEEIATVEEAFNLKAFLPAIEYVQGFGLPSRPDFTAAIRTLSGTHLHEKDRKVMKEAV